MENLFDLDLPVPKKRKVTDDDAPPARLAAVDTVDAIAGFTVDCIKSGRPAVDAAGLLHFTGISAKGYGSVAFPVSEALDFARALVAFSKGLPVTPPNVTIAELVDPNRKNRKATMLENLIVADAYVGSGGTVIALKIAGSNHEGSSKPKATLVSVNPIALRTLACYIASAARKAHTEQAEGYAGILTECLVEFKALRAKMQALVDE